MSKNLFYVVSPDCHSLQIQSMPYSISEIKFRITKRIPIDFNVSCFANLTENVYAVAGKDNYLRVFDAATQRTIQATQGHSDQIILISPIFTEEKNILSNNVLNQNNNIVNQGGSGNDINNNPSGSYSKQRLMLITSGLDKNIIIWNFNENILKIYQKFGFLNPVKAVLDLQDNSSLITGDTSGEIILWDYHRAKMVFVFKGQHNSGITSINLIKKYERFVCSSQDNTISLWKLKYNFKNGYIPENCICERIIVDNFGGIANTIVPFIESDLILVGSFDGLIRLYDLVRDKYRNVI